MSTKPWSDTTGPKPDFPLFPMDIYLASGNAHKVQEFCALVAAAGNGLAGKVNILSARDVGGMPAVEEDTGTYVGNARKKAVALLEKLPDDAWALSDDSGLNVDALDGAPGVESANYAGPKADGAANVAKLLGALASVHEEKRAAHFSCVLCLVGKGREPLYFRGRCDGRIAFTTSGAGGFGYDPVFVPDGFAVSFAELSEEQKNQLSHRGKAWAQLEAWLVRFVSGV